MWVKMWDILTVGFSRGSRFSYFLCLDWIRLPSISMTWGPLMVGWFLLHGVPTIMQFCVSTVPSMPQVSRLFSGLPIHVFLVWLTFDKLSVTWLNALLTNCQSTGGGPNLLPTIIAVAVDSYFWPWFFMLQFYLLWLPSIWIQTYGVIQKVGWWGLPSIFKSVWLGSFLDLK